MGKRPKVQPRENVFSFINKNDYSAIFVRVAIRPRRYEICVQAAVGQILRKRRGKVAATAGRRVLLNIHQQQ